MIYKVIGIIGVSILCFGQQKITDVKTSDAAYPAIKRSVQKGYFTLMDGTKFLPDQGVNRKELAILLDRMDSLSTKATLSANDIVQLKSFSKQFKTYLESQQNSKVLVDSEVKRVKTEQKTMNYDVSRLEEQVQEQNTFMWIAIGLGVLGIVF